MGVLLPGMLRGRGRVYPSEPPAGAGDTKAAIVSRSPAFYAPLSSPTAEDVSGNALSVSVLGGSASNSANGWTLPTGVYLQVPHNAVFESDTNTASVGWVDSEVTVVFEVVVASLASKIALASKADGNRFSNSWWVDIEADGSVRLVVEDPMDKHTLDTKPGLITVGPRYQIAIQFGRRGVRLWVDSNPSLNSWELLEHHCGWDFRLRGGVAETVCDGERWLNNHPLRIGHNGFEAPGEVTVRHWAVFKSGTLNVDPWVRTGTRLTQADVEAIAGVALTGALPDRYRTGATTNITTATDIRTAIQGRSSGDTLVLAAGTYNFSSNIIVPSGVRIVGATGNRADVIINGTALGARMLSPDPTWLNITGLISGDVAKGDYFVTLSSAADILEDDIIIFVSSVEQEFDSHGTTGEATFRKRSDVVSVDQVSGTTILFRQRLYEAYPAAQRVRVWRLRPGWKNNVFESLTLRARLNAGTTDANWVPVFEARGCAGLRLRNFEAIQNEVVNDQRCALLSACVGVDIINSRFETRSTELSVTYHAYPCQLYSGRSVRAIGTEFKSDGWSANLDVSFKNVAGSQGWANNPGWSDHVAFRHAYEIDCTNTAIISVTTLGIGGHERSGRHIVCGTDTSGIQLSRGSYHDSINGLTINYPQMNVGDLSRKSFFYHIAEISPQAHTGMWRSTSGDSVKDMVYDTITHNANMGTNAGSFSNCFIRNCSSPNPFNP